MEKKPNLIELQLAALAKRLADGYTLTAAQQQLVKDSLPADEIPQDSGGDIVASGSELARRLGVSRQVVSYHAGRSEAPPIFSVDAWRDYLAAFGRKPISVKSPGKRPRMDFEDGISVATETFSNGIRPALARAIAAAKIKATPKQIDRVSIEIFLEGGKRVQAVADKWQASGPMQALDGEYFWPAEIEEAAARIGFDLTAAAT